MRKWPREHAFRAKGLWSSVLSQALSSSSKLNPASLQRRKPALPAQTLGTLLLVLFTPVLVLQPGMASFLHRFSCCWCWQEPRAGTAGWISYAGTCGVSSETGLASQSHANISQAVMLIMTGIGEQCFLNLTKWLSFEELIFFFFFVELSLIHI